MDAKAALAKALEQECTENCGPTAIPLTNKVAVGGLSGAGGGFEGEAIAVVQGRLGDAIGDPAGPLDALVERRFERGRVGGAIDESEEHGCGPGVSKRGDPGPGRSKGRARMVEVGGNWTGGFA